MSPRSGQTPDLRNTRPPVGRESVPTGCGWPGACNIAFVSGKTFLVQGIRAPELTFKRKQDALFLRRFRDSSVRVNVRAGVRVQHMRLRHTRTLTRTRKSHLHRRTSAHTPGKLEACGTGLRLEAEATRTREHGRLGVTHSKAVSKVL